MIFFACKYLLYNHFIQFYVVNKCNTNLVYVVIVIYLGKPLAVIHFDAHCDTWKDHFNEPSGHGNLY